MRVEPHTGVVVLDCAGAPVTLCLTWRVLSRFRGAYGPQWDEVLEAAFTARDTETLAGFLALATDRPAEWWLDSPAAPLVPTIRALQTALMVAYFGPGGAQTNPQTAAAPMKVTAATWWKQLSALGGRLLAILFRSGR